MNLISKKLQITNRLSAALLYVTLISTVLVTNKLSAESPTPISDPLLRAMRTELDRE